MWKTVEENISRAIGSVFVALQRRPVSGGSVSEAYMLCDGDQCFFVKVNPVGQEAVLATEVRGLEELRKAKAFRVPNFVCLGEASGSAFLVLEFLALRPVRISDEEAFAESLFHLHSYRGTGGFGFGEDNFIALSKQSNRASLSWSHFWVEERLKPQALKARHLSEDLYLKVMEVCDSIDFYFQAYDVKPSLLHGDLWAGNVAVVGDELSVFDPSVYYGDCEADLAMTELMGGFSKRFYERYKSLAEIDEEGYATRKDLYNLYHVLNHLNLFGLSYSVEALSLTERLLAKRCV